MKRTTILLAVCAATALNINAQRTTKLTASKASDYGIAYSLPVTVFDIVLETSLTKRTPGEFSNYAQLYLNADNAITAPEYNADIKSVSMVPRGIPDAENKWVVEFKGTGITYMCLDENGVPVSINYENLELPEPLELPTARKAEPTPLETPAAREAVTREMMAASSVSKRAQLTAQRIFDLRETRSDLISGNAENTPPDGESMKLMLDNLSAQEAALNAMFAGTESTWTQVNTLTYTPAASGSDNVVIARLSPIDGIVSPDDLSGEPIYLTMAIESEGKIPADDSGAPKKAPRDGVAYNIPGSVKISLKFRDKEIYSGVFDTAQFGTTFFIDPKLFADKKKPVFMIFDPVTGGLREIGTLGDNTASAE